MILNYMNFNIAFNQIILFNFDVSCIYSKKNLFVGSFSYFELDQTQTVLSNILKTINDFIFKILYYNKIQGIYR